MSRFDRVHRGAVGAETSMPKWKVLASTCPLRGSFRYARTGCCRLKGLTGQPYAGRTTWRWATTRVCVNWAPATLVPDRECAVRAKGGDEDGGGDERPATPADVCGDGFHAATVERASNGSVTGRKPLANGASSRVGRCHKRQSGNARDSDPRSGRGVATARRPSRSAARSSAPCWLSCDPTRRGRADRAARRPTSGVRARRRPRRRRFRTPSRSSARRSGRRSSRRGRPATRSMLQTDAGRRTPLRAARERGALARADRRAGLVEEALELWRGPPLADFAYEPFAADRDRPARGASVGGARGADRGRARARRRSRARRRARGARRARTRCASGSRGQLMLALYRVGPAGRGAPGVPGRAPRRSSTSSGSSRRRAAGAPRLDPAPGVRAQPQAVPGAGEDTRGGRPRARSRVGSFPCSGPGPSAEDGQGLAGRLAEALRLPGRAPRRPHAGLAVRGGHPGRRPALRPAARSLRRGRRARRRSSASWRACPSSPGLVGRRTSCSSRPATATRSSARSRSAARRSTSSPSSRWARTAESSSIARPTGPRRSSRSRTRTRSSRSQSGR